MSRIKLFPHQVKALEDTKKLNKVAYYLDMRGGFREDVRRLGEDGSTR